MVIDALLFSINNFTKQSSFKFDRDIKGKWKSNYDKITHNNFKKMQHQYFSHYKI